MLRIKHFERSKVSRAGVQNFIDWLEGAEGA